MPRLRHLLLVRALPLVLVVSIGVAPGSSASVSSHATFDFTNPVRNIAGPPFALMSGNCTGNGAGGAMNTNCASPCYPSFVIRSDGSVEFPLADTVACTQYTLAALNVAQAREHVRSVVLPSNYYRLTVTEQLFALVNLERVTRGLPPLVGLVAYLNQTAQRGAVHDQDPVMASAHYNANDGAFVSGPIEIAGHYEGGTSIWSGDNSTPLDAVFEWMYDDGWGGSVKATANFACTSSASTGCWGHRDAILGSAFGSRCTTCVTGAGYASNNAENSWTTSYAMIFVEPLNRLAMSFTWNHNVLPYLSTSYEKVTAE